MCGNRFVIIGWWGWRWPQRLLRLGPRGGTGSWGQYKTPDVGGSICAKRRRARSALFSRVYVIVSEYLVEECSVWAEKSEFLRASPVLNTNVEHLAPGLWVSIVSTMNPETKNDRG